MALLLFSSYSVGRPLTRRLVPDPLRGAPLAAIAGLAAWGHAGFWLGVAGLLRPWIVWPLLLGASAAGCRSLRELASAIRERPIGKSFGIAWPALLAVPAVLLAAYPSLDFDATMYHLPYARAFAATGRLRFLPDLRFPVFPQLMEVLFAMAFPAGADAAAQLVSVSATLLSALLLVSWGTLEGSAAAGWLAAAALAGHPIVAYFGATAYVEPGLMLFATAAFFAFRSFLRTGQPGWMALSGAFAGTAAAVKYLGLVLAVLLGLAGLATAVRQRRSRPALFFAGGAVAAIAPWYTRILLATGNPVFPYFSRVFGKSAWDLSGYQPRWNGVGDLLARAATAPYDLIFPTRNFDWHPPFSPFLLVTAPVLLAAFAIRRGWRTLLAAAGLYALFALTLPRDPRYLMPLLPLVSLVAVLTFADAARRWLPRSQPRPGRRLRAAAAACAALLLAPSALYAARLVKRRGPPPVSARGRELYRRHLPLYSAIDFLNRTRGANYSLYAFDAENMAWFASGRFRGDWFGPASYDRMRPAASSPNVLWSELRGMGADCLLFAAWRPAGVDSREFLRYFRPLYADSRARVYAVRDAPF